MPEVSKGLLWRARVMLRQRDGVLTVVGLVGLAVVIVVGTVTMMQPRTALRVGERREPDKAWQAVAPGRIEPLSGEIKVTSVVVGRVAEVLVKPNAQVFAGEPLIRLQDDELQARLVAADAQVAMRERARDDQKVTGKASDRRRAEDALNDAETDLFNARAALDASAVVRRAGGGSDADLGPARAALARAQEQLKTRTTALRAMEEASPLPSEADALLKSARAERLVARAAAEKMTIRAPIAGTVLQVSVRVGETAMPSAAQPLLVIGDLSKLRVRAELDDSDVGEIKVGQPVVVRAAAFPGREFAGKVTAIAPIVGAASTAPRGSRGPTDVEIVEVLIDLADRGPLVSGIKVDAYFRRAEAAKP